MATEQIQTFPGEGKRHTEKRGRSLFSMKKGKIQGKIQEGDNKEELDERTSKSVPAALAIGKVKQKSRGKGF